MNNPFHFLTVLAFFVAVGGAFCAETKPAKYPGLKELQVGTAVKSIRPGQEFTIGLQFSHEKGYHTYWKSPGVVGVPVIIDWKDFPEGFVAGEMQWPAPQKTLMASINAWGYETDTCLLIPVKAPAKLDGIKSVTFQGRIGWMCCATSCYPGHHDFSLTLPVADESDEVAAADEKWQKRFQNSRERFPQSAPEGWKFSAREIDANTIQLVVHAPSEVGAIDWSKVYFFSDDNQVDSDAKQKVAELSGVRGAVFTFSRPDFAPKNPKQLSGVIHLPSGWPGIDGHPWMIASAPWPGYEERESNGEDKEKE